MLDQSLKKPDPSCVSQVVRLNRNDYLYKGETVPDNKYHSTYNDCPRLRFEVNCEYMTYQFDTRYDGPLSFDVGNLKADLKTSHKIMGHSEKLVDTSKDSYKLLPNTNEFYKGKKIFISITEQVDKIADGRPHFPFVSYKRQKAEPRLTLHWQVRDRALFPA